MSEAGPEAQVGLLTEESRLKVVAAIALGTTRLLLPLRPPVSSAGSWP
ncbi:MAG TPA: hypothetical protein VGR21_09755 [Cryptosporangiaceae bacterium]|nr:hypothetical protein [Cryptosporangiaceae bacterium]